MNEKQSILVVDDEVHMLRLLERILGGATPHEVVCTPNSLEVPQILESRSFDLVIADLKMPGLDGLDLLRWLREKERPEELIMITAFGSLESTMEALKLGAFDYITKPFKKEQILLAVERAMRWQRVRRAAGRLEELLAREPYAEAERAFRALYLKELAGRCGGDLDACADRSRVPFEEIQEALAGADEDGSKEEPR